MLSSLIEVASQTDTSAAVIQIHAWFHETRDYLLKWIGFVDYYSRFSPPPLAV